MAGILVSPRFGSQAKKRSALYKKRNESPTFKDVLRERCHSRIKASRCALIEKFRGIDEPEELQNVFKKILREEARRLLCSEGFVEEVVHTEEPQDLEEDNLLIGEYEKILAEEESNLDIDWENQVICPLCEMSILTINGQSPTCLKCAVLFPPVESLVALKTKLDSVLMNHSENCDHVANFAVMSNQELSGLFLICDTCFCFSQVL